MNPNLKRMSIALCVSALIVAGNSGLAGVSSNTVAANSKDTPLPLKIIHDSEAAYASLSSYSDTGKVLMEMNGRTLTTVFNIHLARSNLYRIEWEQTQLTATTSMTSRGAAWSAGDGDFFLGAAGIQRMKSPELALASAAAVSSSASLTVPGLFFDIVDLSGLKQLTAMSADLVQQQDATIGTVDCYVISGERNQNGLKIATTLWIGKKDYMIHKSKRVMEHLEKTPIPEGLDVATKDMMQKEMRRMQQEPVIYTETHENISINNSLKKSDFIHEEPTGTGVSR
jgi:outer membrane lipoprotein-sorting protein